MTGWSDASRPTDAPAGPPPSDAECEAGLRRPDGRSRRLGSRPEQAGGRAELHVWSGGFHGFTGLVPDAALSRAAVAARRGWLRRLLGG
ncbi:Carboxylesterase NlhH (fragment) [Frankia canadensis]|uniref:Carboxylesterase NlhH n=1 Tax=Frankia canadensis TaxID=1836972 RepID=A0A2I2KXB3_9ACTN